MTGKFRPRHCCNWREYEYYLPRSAMAGAVAPAAAGGEAIDADAAIAAFDYSLRSLCGTHSWHNFCKAGKVFF